MDDRSEQARLINLARAICRSRRLDPDLPLDEAALELHSATPVLAALRTCDVPAWIMFVEDAKRIVAGNRDHAVQH